MRRSIGLTIAVGLLRTGCEEAPSEAEWEHACRAGTESPWHFGALSDTLVNFAWYKKNTQEPGAVAQKLPNPLGLYDMYGNVSEWCADWYGRYPRDFVENPTGPESGEMRVVRGGHFAADKWHVTSATRDGAHPVEKSPRIGFRVARY